MVQILEHRIWSIPHLNVHSDQVPIWVGELRPSRFESEEKGTRPKEGFEIGGGLVKLWQVVEESGYEALLAASPSQERRLYKIADLHTPTEPPSVQSVANQPLAVPPTRRSLRL